MKMIETPLAKVTTTTRDQDTETLIRISPKLHGRLTRFEWDEISQSLRVTILHEDVG